MDLDDREDLGTRLCGYPVHVMFTFMFGDEEFYMNKYTPKSEPLPLKETLFLSCIWSYVEKKMLKKKNLPPRSTSYGREMFHSAQFSQNITHSRQFAIRTATAKGKF